MPNFFISNHRQHQSQATIEVPPYLFPKTSFSPEQKAQGQAFLKSTYLITEFRTVNPNNNKHIRKKVNRFH